MSGLYRRMSLGLCFVAGWACVAAFWGVQAQAIDYTFVPGGPNDWWMTSSNWNPVRVPNSVNDRVIFNASANPNYSTNVHNQWYTIQEMRFATSSNWRIYNNRQDPVLDGPAGSAWITQNGSGTVTFDTDLQLNDTTTIGGTGTGNITVNGSILPVYRNGVYGAGGLVKEGSYMLTLNPVLKYAGPTTVNDGTLRLAGGAGFPSAGSSGKFTSPHTLNVNTGGTLQINGDWITGDGLVNQINVNGGTLQFLNSDNYMGNIELTGGAITTSGGLRPWRTGNWGSGLITVNPSAASSTISGSLCFVGTGAAPNTTFDVANGGAADDLVVSALVFDHPGFERRMMLVKDGPGKVILSNNSNTFAGGVTINDGTLSITSLAGGNTPCALGASYGVAAMLIFNGGILEYTGPTVGGINRAFTINAAGATLDIADAGTTVTWTDAAGAGPIIGTGTLTKAGPGRLILAGSNNYSGGTIISEGTLQLGRSNSAGTGVITLGDANTGANEVRINMPSNTTWPPPITLGNDINVSNLAGGRAVIAGVGGTWAAVYQGTITLQNKDVIIRNDIAGDRTAIEGKITGTGNVTIEGVASGRVNWTNTGNDFVGDLTIVPGATLQVNGGGVIPDTADVTVDGRMGFYSSAEAIDALGGSGTVNLWPGWSSTALTVGADDGSGTFSGEIQGAISLIKTGSGTQVLTGANTYVGSTQVLDGELLVNGTHFGGATYTVFGGVLGGTGEIDAAVDVQGGAFAPGVSPGGIVTGDLTLGSASSFQVELGGTFFVLDGTEEYDRAVVNGDVIVNQGLLEVSLFGGFVPVQNDRFLIVENRGSNPVGGVGIFAGLPEGQVFAADGSLFRISYVGGTGNDIVLTTYVPEPSTLLIWAGLLGLGLWLRRRRGGNR